MIDVRVTKSYEFHFGGDDAGKLYWILKAARIQLRDRFCDDNYFYTWNADRTDELRRFIDETLEKAEENGKENDSAGRE